jgi:predicted MPP superfamily phosphohydrolase
MAGITWLHLSDWHQKGPDFDRQVVRDALIHDIREREKISPDLAKIDFLVFSGDVAHAGKKEEYEAAIENLFKPLLEVTGLSTELLFIVPGNHDFDRSAFKLLPEDVKKPFESDDRVKEWLTDAKNRKHLLEPFENYGEFVSKYTSQIQPEYASIGSLEIDEKRIVLLGLNSALMAGRNKDATGEVNDYGFLTVGEPQIHEALKQMEGSDVRIAVLHHPLEWLTEFDRNRIERPLGETCHFILCGHQHKPQVNKVAGTEGDCVIIPAGASYDRRNCANGYNFVHLDFERGQGRVYLRRWSDPRRKWMEDTDSYDQGQYNFSLPKNLSPSLSQDGGSVRGLVLPQLTSHYQDLSHAITHGLIVPFLGADINLCDRPVPEQNVSKPWDWEPKGDYPPTNIELAAYIDKKYGRTYLQKVRCPLCDPQTFPYKQEDFSLESPLKGFPPKCPLNTEIISQLDLQHVAQFFNTTLGSGQLKAAINQVSAYPYKPNRLHKLLAKLSDCTSGIEQDEINSATRYPLIVTTNFDSTLEQAFIEASQPFDLVFYESPQKRFVHQRFDREIEENMNAPIVKKGEEQPIKPEQANQYEGLSLNERPVILRLYGPAQWSDIRGGNFAITEDHFLSYLACDFTQMLPAALRKKLNNSYIWFLGYSLSHWHLRLVLNHIWSEQTPQKRGYTWWSVQTKLGILDKALWRDNDVDLIEGISLEDYVDGLEQQLKQKLQQLLKR